MRCFHTVPLSFFVSLVCVSFPRSAKLSCNIIREVSCTHACAERNKNEKGGKPSGADAYRYLTGEAEVGGGAAFLARGGAHAAVGAAG